MKQKTRSICSYFKNIGCRPGCPLAKACAPQAGDTFAILADRMNMAAQNVKIKGFA